MKGSGFEGFRKYLEDLIVRNLGQGSMSDSRVHFPEA
jgi:hypothetical protein